MIDTSATKTSAVAILLKMVSTMAGDPGIPKMSRSKIVSLDSLQSPFEGILDKIAIELRIQIGLPRVKYGPSHASAHLVPENS